MSLSSALPRQTHAIQSEQLFVWLFSDWLFCAVILLTVTQELCVHIWFESEKHLRNPLISQHLIILFQKTDFTCMSFWSLKRWLLLYGQKPILFYVPQKKVNLTGLKDVRVNKWWEASRVWMNWAFNCDMQHMYLDLIALNFYLHLVFAERKSH